jgi:hypothetical protein
LVIYLVISKKDTFNFSEFEGTITKIIKSYKYRKRLLRRVSDDEDPGGRFAERNVLVAQYWLRSEGAGLKDGGRLRHLFRLLGSQSSTLFVRRSSRNLKKKIVLQH